MYVKPKGILLRLKNSLDRLSEDKLREAEKTLNEFIKEELRILQPVDED